MSARILEGLDFIEAQGAAAEQRISAVEEARRIWSGERDADAREATPK